MEITMKLKPTILALTLIPLLSPAFAQFVTETSDNDTSLILESTKILENQETPVPDKESPQPLPIEDLKLFVEILEQLKQNYVEPVSDTVLINNAIKGMISELDPHSVFYDEKAFKDAQETSTGSFAGIGVEVTSEDGLIRVIAPIDDTPASKAGIQAGDLIIKIDSTAVQSIEVEKAIDMLRGEPKTEVTLTLIRANNNTPITVTLIRDIVKTKSVRSQLIDNQYAYVRLSQFQERSAEEIQKAISDLQSQAQARESKVKGLILDLRNNPGGLLQQSISISDIFLETGLIVYTQGRSEDSREDFKATPGDIMEGAPIVVLINAGSASASEIVAGALQDQKRAVIVGEKSFGKGSVQSMISFNNGKGIKYTTARYYTPSGRSIQAEGIVPDIELIPFDVKAKASVTTFREENLASHLEKNQKTNTKNKSTSADSAIIAEKDNMLYEAINILKSLIFSKENRL